MNPPETKAAFGVPPSGGSRAVPPEGGTPNETVETLSNNAEFNRRDFLKGGSFATLMTMMGGVPLFADPVPEAKPETKPADGPKLKVAVIGLGQRGREILDQLGRSTQAEVAALCDNYPAFLRRSSSKAPGAAQVEDYKAVLANKDIAAVVIATPSHQHREIAVAALAAGKHVYCEAPLATTVEDAKAIALAAKAAVGKNFQPGLQMRSHPQRHFLLPFIRSGALGKSVMARAQWHKKQSWRATSPNAEREKLVNWRLSRATSSGLIGEIGIHALDQAGWFLNAHPVAVTGFGSTMLWKDDGRDVPDTVQVVIEFPGGVRMNYDASLATSFDTEFELLFGSDATVLMREDNLKNEGAWMFKEVDSALLGWEIYARKENFFKETGIALVAGASLQKNMANKGGEGAVNSLSPLYYALESFLGNCMELDHAVEDFTALFGSANKQALAESLSGLKLNGLAANYKDGYAATVLATMANEAVLSGKRIELKPEMFELA